MNSEGLPNNGIDYYIDEKTIADTMGHNPLNKPYMVSISGKNIADNLQMLEKITDVIKNNPSAKIVAVELNLACPNIGKRGDVMVCNNVHIESTDLSSFFHQSGSLPSGTTLSKWKTF